MRTKSYNVTFSANAQVKNIAVSALRAEVSEMQEMIELTADADALVELIHNAFQLEALADVIHDAEEV